MKIKVTQTAFQELESKYYDDTKVFRIMINGFGWGGPVFGVVLDEQSDDDHVEVKDGVKFAVNEDIIDQYGSFSIDYTSNFFRKGFIVSAEYGASTC